MFVWLLVLCFCLCCCFGSSFVCFKLSHSLLFTQKLWRFSGLSERALDLLLGLCLGVPSVSRLFNLDCRYPRDLLQPAREKKNVPMVCKMSAWSVVISNTVSTHFVRWLCNANLATWPSGLQVAPSFLALGTHVGSAVSSRSNLCFTSAIAMVWLSKSNRLTTIFSGDSMHDE